MAYEAKLRIGGLIDQEGARQLLLAIRKDGPLDAPDGILVDPDEVDELLVQWVGSDGYVTLYKEDTSGGCFAAIEDACRDLGLAFDRTVMEEGETLLTTLRDGHVETVEATKAGEPVVPVCEVQQLRAELDEGNTEELWRSIDRLCEVVPGPLPRLEIGPPRTYRVLRREVWVQGVEVTASSGREALARVEDGEGRVIEDTFELSEVLPRSQHPWEVTSSRRQAMVGWEGW